jgi:hypothetical protein
VGAPRGQRAEHPSRVVQLAMVSSKYGVANLASKFGTQLCEIYDQYITSVIPPGDKPLE